jgi:CheY-like chemotaxis protein
VAAVRQQRPDVMVSDIGMPGKDGYELMRLVRALPPLVGGTLPAIALTSYGAAEDRDRAFAVGYESHVVKPIEPALLVAAVAALVRPARLS